MTERNERLAWSITVAAFLCLALWPLWSARFPPMQDYPQHLFHAQALRVHNDPAFDYNRYYEFRLRPIYATFFLTTLFFAKFVPIEIAGKLSLSLYPLLIAIVVLKLGRRLGKSFAPWGALLFFPLAFNQDYFLGTLNYILSLPILILALLDFEDLMEGDLRAWPVVRHSFWQVVLFVTHPLSFLAYVTMAVVAAIITQRRTNKFWSKLATAMGIAVLLLGAGWIENKAIPSSEVSAPGIFWLPLKLTMQLFALMFTGMQRWRGADSVAVILWGGTFAGILGALLFDWKEREISSLPARQLIFLTMGIMGVLVLPFRIGNFTYLNTRISAIVYFLVALLVAHVRFRGWLAGCVAVLLGLCMIRSTAKQARLSAEVAEIVPVVYKIPPNSRILPLVFDRGSPELDRFSFDPHVHDYNYYHILIGGGFNPYVSGSPLQPVQYKSGAERPAPAEYRPEEFTWSIHSADYQYFLARGAPASFAGYMAPTCDKLFVSGKWTLFARKAKAGVSN
jgi:hypothetical protein